MQDRTGWLLPLAVALALTAQSVTATAQDTPRPANAAADVDKEDASKFFWFHKDGADPGVARADIQYCLIQTSAMAGRVQQNPAAYMGLIGALVGGIINGITQSVEARRMRDAGMRKCMKLYGYVRYRVPEAQWNPMMRGENALDRLVAYATGPTPQTERLDS